MKRIALLLIVFLSVHYCSIIAQSLQSDSLYAIGVELYNQQRYAEAIPMFEKAKELDIAEINPESLRSGYSASWLASCYYKLGDIQKAKSYSKYEYKLPPVDRRKTVEIDNLMDAIMPMLKSQDYDSALVKLKILNDKEYKLFDKDHYLHMTTNGYIAMCDMSLNQYDEAIPYLEETVRLIRHNYCETDTMQLTQLDNLYNIYSQKGQFDKAEAINKDFERVINSNYDTSHPYQLEAKSRCMMLMIMQRKWDDAKNALPSLLYAAQICNGNDSAKINDYISSIRQWFENAGRREECAYIDKFSVSNLHTASPQESFYAYLKKFNNEINTKNIKDAEKTLDDISNFIITLPKTERIEYDNTLEWMKCVVLFMDQRLDEAKDLYLRLKGTTFSLLTSNDIIKSLQLVTKMGICLSLSDYEGAIDAIDQEIEMLDPSLRNNYLNLYAVKACFNAMSGNYQEAKKLTGETISLWNKKVLETESLYRLDKDTAELNQVLNIFDLYIRNNHMADSARYTIREIKSEYLLLKAKVLRHTELYQLDYGYYDCMSDYALELIKMHKYPEAQELMDSWLDEWRITFDLLPKESNESAYEERKQKAFKALEDALYFRCDYCYEKRDSAAKKAFDDLYDYMKFRTGDEFSDECLEAKSTYYDFMGDSEGLLNFVIQNNDNSLDELSAYGLNYFAPIIANKYRREGNSEKILSYWDRIIKKALNNYDSTNEEDDIIFGTLDKTIKYYTREKKDTDGLMKYYANEIWPKFDVFGDRHLEYFLKSINQFAVNIRDSSFIPYLEQELIRSGNLIDTPYHKASYYQIIAGVLYCGDNTQDLALKYLVQARELVKEDIVLGLLFDCFKHKTIHHLSSVNWDNGIELGYDLIKRMSSDVKFKNTHEYLALIIRQMEMLKSRNMYDDMVDIGESYFKSKCSEYPVDLFNEEHTMFNEIRIINNNILKDILLLQDQNICELVFEAKSALNAKDAEIYALKVIKDKYNNLETSMKVNSVAPWQCDDLISMTSKYAYRHRTDSLKIYAYNTSLLCKGLQLRSNNAIRAIIKKSGHRGALRKLEELETVMYNLPSATGARKDSLLTKRQELEEDLHRLSSSFGDYKKMLYTSWENVQAAMGQNDLAIELTYVTKDYNDIDNAGYKYGYYASVLNKKMKTPEIVYICGDDNITSDLEIYESSYLSELIMQQLKPYLKNIKNIYYSPAGEFNNISIESLPLPEDSGKTLAAKYNIYRVSSTREIIGTTMAVDGRDAIVFGGLSYDTSLEELEEDSKKYTSSRAITINNPSDVDSKAIRAVIKDIPYLEGTLSEAETITSTINASGNSILNAVSVTGPAGTEASFKALDGKNKRIIHIATHGFYLKQKEYDQIVKTSERGNDRMSGEDKSLMRSGLFFAGALNKYIGEEIPEGVEDGILTSQEIANMDLSGLDLCTLSACQTAQGDISSEGVYGLQRGFKKAGAKSILMSLWKVDDEATSLMMTEFYKHWITERLSKYQALELAKQAVRSHVEKGWNKPQYWASFILLDGIN